MTKEEMIELAKQAGWEYAHGDSGFEPLWTFAKLIAVKEREECAKMCDESEYPDGSDLAHLIRARGQE